MSHPRRTEAATAGVIASDHDCRPGELAGPDRRVCRPGRGAAGRTVVTLLRGRHAAGAGATRCPTGSAAQVYLKVEGANPTGSFKDRGMTVAVTHALAAGAKAVICASTGNTSASAAAYAARAGLTSAVLVPQGEIAAGKLAQAVALRGADPADRGQLRRLPGTGPQDAAVDHQEIALVNSVNPVRIEGQKTAAFEICDTLGRAPDIHYLPVGNAGNITAYWKGYREYFADGVVGSLPRMFGFQAAGAAPLVLGHPVLHPDTIATAIRIGAPASWDGAIDARDASDGLIDSVTDEQILHAYKLLAVDRGRVRRAGVGRVGGRTAGDLRGRPAAGRVAGGLHRHRATA